MCRCWVMGCAFGTSAFGRGTIGHVCAALFRGSTILRSAGTKCQTSSPGSFAGSLTGDPTSKKIGLAQRESSHQPAARLRAQPCHLKKNLRSSFGKGSAAGHLAQRERRIGLRTRVQPEAAARMAHVDGGRKLHEKSSARGQAAYREGECRFGTRLPARRPDGAVTEVAGINAASIGSAEAPISPVISAHPDVADLGQPADPLEWTIQ